MERFLLCAGAAGAAAIAAAGALWLAFLLHHRRVDTDRHNAHVAQRLQDFEDGQGEIAALARSLRAQQARLRREGGPPKLRSLRGGKRDAE